MGDGSRSGRGYAAIVEGADRRRKGKKLLAARPILGENPLRTSGGRTHARRPGRLRPARGALPPLPAVPGGTASRAAATPETRPRRRRPANAARSLAGWSGPAGR